jgi:hypothetical protein
MDNKWTEDNIENSRVVEVRSRTSVRTPEPNLRFRFGQVRFFLLAQGRFSSRFWPWEIGSNLFEPTSVIGCSKILMIKNLFQKWKRRRENFHHESSQIRYG